jgi:streptogramin lyase
MRRALLGAALALLALAPAAAGRERFDVRLLARVPAPGQPALALVARDRTIYEGTFTNSSGTPNGPSKVFAYSPGGRLLRTYTVRGQDPNADNGVQVAAEDADGKLYLLDQHPARVIQLNPRTGEQKQYGIFKDVPPCPPRGVGNECSDTVMDNPPEPDYAAWDPDGSLYVTDYQQGLIWRVPPRGGLAHVWFTDPQIDGAQFGPAGIMLMPDHRTLMLATSSGGVLGPSPTTGELYTLPIEPNGTPGRLRTIYESGSAEAPDGFALAKSGNVYLALVGPNVNKLAVIAPDGHEIARISHEASGPRDVPFDEPASVWFDGRRLIVANDAFFSGDPSHFALFDVYAGEQGRPVFIPRLHPRYTVTAVPGTVAVGRPVVLRVRALRNGRALRGAELRFGHLRARTGRDGRARMRARVTHAGGHAVRLIVGGHRAATAPVLAR